MPVSFAQTDTAQMELSPAKVIFDGVDMGGTAGNVKVSIQYTKAEMKIDQTGETVVDRRVSGLTCKIETVISEIQNKQNWKVAMPNANKVGVGPYSVYFQSKLGESDYALAKTLVLHPLSKADIDKAGDFNFYKVCAESATEITYGPTEQQGLKIVWNVYPDTATTPSRFFTYGDPTIGIVHATAGIPVFTGTGNGVMSAVSVFDGYTITESIVAKCVGVPAANESNWVVQGSVSGVLGYFQIVSGSFSFVCPKIAFTLADGTTDFILNDQFAIATTASNFA